MESYRYAEGIDTRSKEIVMIVLVTTTKSYNEGSDIKKELEFNHRILV